MTVQETGAADAGGSSLHLDVRTNGVAVLTFDRPEVRNAVNWPLYQRLGDLLDEVARREKEIAVLVLRGEGGAFCAGGDISFMQQMFSGEIDKADVGALALKVFRAQTALPQPTIAVVDGPAIGLGCTLALGCDLVFASTRAVFADPHVQMGLVPGDGAALIWPLLVGPARAKEFLFTGDPLRGPEAERLGLVNRVYPPETVDDEAMAFAARLASGPPVAIRGAKSLVNIALRSLGEHVVPQGLTLESLSQESDYHRKAVEGFLSGSPLRF
ncbi:MAG TPA: enoyl-CoA hydratase/isomerase family protein [Sporichthya sp.]|jgi:enoyl-CoA hydratase|nr:enoyl-CoA hydratase/isomerase family protein [Sporichthya sp.]